MLSLTMERQLAWLKAISRDDITKEKLSNVFVCAERHFVSGTVGRKVATYSTSIYILCLGKPAYEMYKFDVDWSPSQHLGHDKLILDNAKLAEAQ